MSPCQVSLPCLIHLYYDVTERDEVPDRALTAKVEELCTTTAQSNLGAKADGTRRGER